MKVPISWLKDYVDIKISIDELKEKLFSCGLEVEEVIVTGGDIKNVVAAKILKAEKHPDADKLKVCTVDVGKNTPLQIVTGANNVGEGDTVALALDGAVLAGGKTIVSGNLRGVLSQGMMCSGQELGINDDLYDGASVDGVLKLNSSVKAGMDIREAVGLSDVIFDINVTANRPDCQSILGIAREVSAVTGEPLKMPNMTFKTGNFKTSDCVNISVEDGELCPRYIGSYVKDVKIAKSPQWLRKKLYSVGIRSINNIVDITNFVLLELGQPMHAFDFEKLGGGKIVVRRAKDKEKITTLDEKEFELNSSNLVICDAKKPVALAGIMGGLDSGIGENTSQIVFESAKFKRDNIRRSSKALGQRSDSSSRFEKGVDAYTCALAINRALHLIYLLGCGEIAADVIDVLSEKQEKKVIAASASRINGLLGIEIPIATMKEILEKLDIATEISGDNLKCTIPLYREDIDGYPDLAEEIIRIYGYSHIKPSFLKFASVTGGGKTKEQAAADALKELMLASGMNETVTYSFISPKSLGTFGFCKDGVGLLNPLGEELSVMRTTLVPSMFGVVLTNYNRKNLSGRFFEVANIYIPKKLPLDELPKEELSLICAAYGEKEDFYTLKGVAENIAEKFGTEFKFEKCKKSYLHIGRSAQISCGGVVLGAVGQISPEITAAAKLDSEVYVLELSLEKLFGVIGGDTVYKNISKYPAVERDLAVVFDETVSWQSIVDTVKSAGGENLVSVELFDIYRGEKIECGKMSVAFSMKFNSLSKTLGVDEIDLATENILKALKEKTGGVLRS